MSDDRPFLNSHLALEKLRSLVELKAGQPDYQLPPERELAAEMGLGRRAVRRALEVLEAQGRIWRQQGKGTFIGPRPVGGEAGLNALAIRTNPMEVMEARLQIEPPLARLAALRATPADMETLEQLAKKLAQTDDADSRELWDSAFHRRIAEAAANTVLLALFDVVDRIRQQADWRRLRDAARTSDRLAVYVGQHEDILNAILCRDGDAAESAMRDHLTLLQKNLRTLITGQRRAVQTLVAMMDQPPEKEPTDAGEH